MQVLQGSGNVYKAGAGAPSAVRTFRRFGRPRAALPRNNGPH